MTCSKEEIIDSHRNHKDLFAVEFSVKKLGIFGSYARGEETHGSDIDIVVELEQPDLFYVKGSSRPLKMPSA